MKATRLRKGATIGVVSPASPSERKSEVTRAQEYLENLGYKIVIGKNVNKTKGFTAASEEERASDINEFFRRDDIDAIFVTQGGYGSAQLIDKIDYDAIRKNPKIFTGFSDITSLHLAIYKKTGLTTFHSPGMARFNDEDLTEYTREQFFKALEVDEPLGNISLANKKKWLYSLGEGSAEGIVIGGNMTLVCASLGTDYEIDVKDRILFLEEVETEPWVIDHMFSHLKNAGKLDDALGFIIGECDECRPFVNNPGYYSDVSIEDVIDYYLKPLGKPVLYGLPLGHTDDLATLPMGVKSKIDADNKEFSILESGVK